MYNPFSSCSDFEKNINPALINLFSSLLTSASVVKAINLGYCENEFCEYKKKSIT